MLRMLQKQIHVSHWVTRQPEQGCDEKGPVLQVSNMMFGASSYVLCIVEPCYLVMQAHV